MNRSLPFVIALMVVACACGGGGGGGGVVDPSPTPLTASFVAAQPSPGANTVSMASGGGTDDIVAVRVDVTGTSDVWGAAFDVQFNPVYIDYVGYTPGTLLEQGGQTVSYTVRPPTGSSGIVVVGVSRVGQAPAVDVTTTRTLVNLTFRVKSKGSYPLDFGPGASLLDASVASISGLVEPWSGGSLQGN